MKTKLIVIGLAAVTLLSFTVASSAKKVAAAKAKTEFKTSSQSGFALEDKDQF